MDKNILPRLTLGLLLLLLVIFATGNLAGAQTPTSQEPEGQGSPSDADSPIPHTLLGRANCLRCHLDGFRGASAIPLDHTDYTNVDCLDCHEPSAFPAPVSSPSDLSPGALPTPIVHPEAEGRNTCYDCHVLLDEKHEGISEEWQEGVHGKADIGCADCHGGDPGTDEMNLSMAPEAGFIAVPSRSAISGICGGCHADVERMRQYNLPTDQYAKYMESVHGTKLLEGDTKVALCVDCHGVHDIKKASDPSADVYPLNVPALCSRCHSDTAYMEPYNIPTDQYDTYEESVHGKALLTDQDVRAPNCASCHGSHAAKPPDDEEVVNVCGKCHTATQDYYEESLHARLESNAPKCWTCHGTHDVTTPDESMFINTEPLDKNCGACHLDEESFRMDKNRFARPEDRRCDTCHHEGSWILVQVEALHAALTEADQAYWEADETIQQAAARGMIVSGAENKLAEARTSLISARATLHTTKLPMVSELTDDAKGSAETAREMAAKRLSENIFRRQAMIIAVGAIVFTIIILYAYKRQLYRQLDQEDETGD